MGNVGEICLTIAKWPNAPLCLDRKGVFKMTKVVLAPYDDLVVGYPRSHARDAPPKILKYPDGQTVSNPKATPSALLGGLSAKQ
jgi:hypothetical protein